jgi:hypothetical protein
MLDLGDPELEPSNSTGAPGRLIAKHAVQPLAPCSAR